MKKNPLKNIMVMFKLDPYAQTRKRMAKIAEEKNKKKKEEVIMRKRGVSSLTIVNYTDCKKKPIQSENRIFENFIRINLILFFFILDETKVEASK